VDGKFTGRLIGDILHGPAKGDAVRELAECKGYDLTACHAYSDSANDLPMLTWSATRTRSTRTTGCASAPRPRAGRSPTTAPGCGCCAAGLPGAALTGAATGAVAAGVALAKRARSQVVTTCRSVPVTKGYPRISS
jgi:hypothetical protein